MRQENKDHLLRFYALVAEAFNVRYMSSGKLELKGTVDAAEFSFLQSFGTLLDTILKNEDQEFDETQLEKVIFNKTIKRLPKEFVSIMDKFFNEKDR